MHCLINAQQIDELNQDEQRWNRHVEQFADYFVLWQKRGVLPMLRKVTDRKPNR